MGQIFVRLINVTITRRELWGASPQRRRAVSLSPAWLFLCCWASKKPSSGSSLVSFIISVFCWKYGLIILQPMSTPPLPVSAFLLRPAYVHSELFNTNGRFLFPFCAQHAIWCAILTDRRTEGPICKCWLPEHPVWKDIHQKLRALFFFPLSLVSLSYYLYGAVRGAPPSWSHFISTAWTSRSNDWCKMWLDN